MLVEPSWESASWPLLWGFFHFFHLTTSTNMEKEFDIVTVVNHSIQKELNLNPSEYFVMFLVNRLSNNVEHPWCTVGNESIGKDLNISRQSVITALNSLESRGFVLRNSYGHKRTSQAIADVLNGRVKNLDTVKKLDTNCKESLQQGVKKLDTNCKESLHNNKKQEELQKENINSDAPLFLKQSREKVTRQNNDIAPLKALPLGNLESEAVRECWANFLDAQTEKGKRITRMQAEAQLKELNRIAGSSKTIACQIISNAIANGWNSFFPLKEATPSATKNGQHTRPQQELKEREVIRLGYDGEL